MEKQVMEMKWKLEMDTGNGNWERNWKQKMHQSSVKCLHGLMSSALCHYSCFLLSIGYMTGFMCFAFTLALCNYVFSVID